MEVLAPGPSLRPATGYAPAPQVYAGVEAYSRRRASVINYVGDYSPGPSAGYAANRNPSYGSSILSTGPIYGYGYDGYGYYGYAAGVYGYPGAYRGYTSAAYQSLIVPKRNNPLPGQNPSSFYIYNPLSPTSGAIHVNHSHL